jgi:hypothetical protein
VRSTSVPGCLNPNPQAELHDTFLPEFKRLGSYADGVTVLHLTSTHSFTADSLSMRLLQVWFCFTLDRPVEVNKFILQNIVCQAHLRRNTVGEMGSTSTSPQTAG